MREYLFRGKRKKDDKWAVGGFHKWETRQPCPFNDELSLDEVKYLIIGNTNADWNMPREICATEVDPETVGQYTGLTDKNGKRIFEGDIVRAFTRFSEIYVSPVAYHDGTFWFKNWSWTKFLFKFEKIEVIGNIHDNPELLENPINTEVTE